MDLDFATTVGGIEDGILSALKTGMTGMGIQSFATYSGDLGSDNLTKRLMEFAKKCPRVMVSYMNGRDFRDAATSAVLKRSLKFRHDCSFAVIVASNDIRSETVRRRGTAGATGAYAMIAKVKTLLSGLMLEAVIDSNTVRLTQAPLMPITTEFITRKQNMTAYAVIFGTTFRWASPDRSVEPVHITDYTVEVESLMEHDQNLPGKPGVEVSVG